MSLRIERLDFKPWGCFENHSLHFSPDAGVVDLVHGPNAAGKSTTSRGHRSLLYGIDQRTPDAHTYPYSDLRIGGRLVLDGDTVDLMRRKGRAATLRDNADLPLAADPIAPALGGLSEEVYLSLFQITHDTLVHGGAELLQGRGEVGASLFAAAAGIATLHGTLAMLDAEADGVFSPRRRTTKLQKAIAELRDAERRLRAGTLRPARHREMEKALGQAQEACEDLSAGICGLEAEARALERQRATAPLFDDRARVAGELETLRDVPALPPDAAEQRVATETALRTGALRLERARAAADRLGDACSGLEFDEALLARAVDIRSVHDDVSATRKAEEDRRKREGELQEARGDLRGAAAAVGVDPEAVDCLRRPAPARRALDACLREHRELVERRRVALERLQDARARRDDDQASLERAPEPRALAALTAAVRTALKGEGMPSELAQARAEARRLSSEALAGLARLRPAPQTVELLRSLPVPARETIRDAAARSAELERCAEALAVDRERLGSESRDLRERQEQLVLEGDAPTAQELHEARRTRAEHWGTVRVAIDGGLRPPPDVVNAFEQDVVECDRVADARSANAAQVERAAHLEARARRLERDGEALDQRKRVLDARRADFARAWSEWWSESGLSVRTPADALAWLDDRGETLDLARAADVSAARADTLGAQLAGHVHALRARLRDLDIPAPDGAGLQDLLAVAEAELSVAQEHATARSALEVALRHSEGDLVAAHRELERADAAWRAWQSAWPGRREQGGVPAGTDPEAAHEIVRAVEEALAHACRIADLERRISGMDRDRELFDGRVRALCTAVAVDLSDMGSQRAAITLLARLEHAEAQRARRDSLEEQRAAAQTDVTSLEHELAQERATMTALLVAAQCQDPADLPHVERQAARARELTANLAQLERRIAEIGEGRFEDLLRDIAGFDRAAAAVRIDEVRVRIDDLREERDVRKEEIGQRKRELRDAEGDAGAVDAAQDAELATTRIRELAIQHAKAKLAAAVVRRAIERYRRLHQDPLLRRANDLFSRFTLGSFVELFVDVDERDAAVLVGRQRDRVLKHVPEMSDGTREQLFLALRIAAIERYVSTSGPVPVVFDDVFLESDEPRSERIFEALGELACQTQVVVLTHHQHLIGVGRRALGERLAVQHLPDVAPTLRPALAA